jgi:hypothetical protein
MRVKPKISRFGHIKDSPDQVQILTSDEELIVYVDKHMAVVKIWQ